MWLRRMGGKWGENGRKHPFSQSHSPHVSGGSEIFPSIAFVKRSSPHSPGRGTPTARDGAWDVGWRGRVSGDGSRRRARTAVLVHATGQHRHPEHLRVSPGCLGLPADMPVSTNALGSLGYRTGVTGCQSQWRRQPCMPVPVAPGAGGTAAPRHRVVPPAPAPGVAPTTRFPRPQRSEGAHHQRCGRGGWGWGVEG